MTPRLAIVETEEMRVNRLTYANIILPINNNRLLFIDETGFNSYTHAKYRYILPGQAVHYMFLTNRRRNVSMVAIISCHRIENFN